MHVGSNWTRTPTGSNLPSFLQDHLPEDAKSKLREIAEKRAEDVEEVMAHLEKTLLKLGLALI